jgi:hypothetical protein
MIPGFDYRKEERTGWWINRKSDDLDDNEK